MKAGCQHRDILIWGPDYVMLVGREVELVWKKVDKAAKPGLDRDASYHFYHQLPTPDYTVNP